MPALDKDRRIFIVIRPASAYGFELGAMAAHYISSNWADSPEGRRELALEHAEDLERAKRKREWASKHPETLL